MRLLLSAIFFGFGVVASAMTVVSSSIDAKLAAAVWVGELEVVSVRSQGHSQLHSQWVARAVVRSVERGDSRGPAVGEVIEVLGPGGEVNEVGVWYDGLARMRNRRVYRVHLKEGVVGDGRWEVAGMGFGLTLLSPRLSRGRQFSRNRTDGSNGEGNGPFLRWEANRIPIPFYLSLPSFFGLPGYVGAIQESFRTWADVQGARVDFLGMGCAESTENINEGVNNVIRVTSNWEFDPSVIAITRNFYVASNSPKAGVILDSDILLNEVHHDFTLTNEAEKHDVQNIVTHEVGHLLGFGHEQAPIDPDATMYAVAVEGETKKRDLHANDLEALSSAYAGPTSNKWIEQSILCSVKEEASTGCGTVRNSQSGSGLAMGLFFLFILWMPRLFRCHSPFEPKKYGSSRFRTEAR